MKCRLNYEWRLTDVMLSRGIRTPEALETRLRERGLAVSLVLLRHLMANRPDLLSLQLLATLCDILHCTPNNLITFDAPLDNSEETNVVSLVDRIRAAGEPTRPPKTP
jgi:DNA-binding Xre family transcriptional regulator